jgi:hypothetical protein
MGLGDILERVLDKGIVIAGDITIYIADVQLLDIKIRLLIASVDRAKEMGISWWERDSYLSPQAKESATTTENRRLRERVTALEAQVGKRSEHTPLGG